ncbi:MAG: HlyD family efflux transporter periplasmic adaptor subunit, partial [Actinobacteria bacterium]|nr:HlyD family efflux transporter periplasmic adaptor subunit [Actinomycetota bacterium]
MFWFSKSSKSGSDASELDAELSRSRLILWLTATILAVFFSWAYFFEITQVSRAPGAIMPSSNVQIVQSQDGGVIRAIKVSAGDLVQRGETMIELDDTSVKADLREAEAKAAGVSASLVRLRAEIFETSADFSGIATAYPQFVVSQKALMEKRRSAQNEEVEALKGILALIREEIDMNLPLMEQGDVSKTEILRLRRQEAEFVAKISNVKNEYFKEAQAEYNQLEEELEGVKQAIVQRRRQLEEKTIAAPINGVVKDIRITSEGGVIRPGEEIMEVVPIEKDFLVEVKLS